MRFSQRKGLRPPAKPLQVESVDTELRNALWSCFSEIYLNTFEGPESYPYGRLSRVRGSNMEDFFVLLWHTYFKLPTDTLPVDVDDAISRTRQHFFEGPWHDVYDFMEFALRAVPNSAESSLRSAWNNMLQRENSGYRILEYQVVEITNDVELSAIESAACSSTESAQQHLRTAIALFADRKAPDYRNSIKESISAVESICRGLSGTQSGTLGTALNVLQAKVGMHGALKAALSSLYGYTSDEHGIRHAMLEEPNLTSSDAKFMLVTCSAFVNYIVGKSTEAQLRLK